jgi:hypothetical protein
VWRPWVRWGEPGGDGLLARAHCSHIPLPTPCCSQCEPHITLFGGAKHCTEKGASRWFQPRAERAPRALPAQVHVAPGAEEAVAFCGGLRAVLAAAGVPASLELPRAPPADRRSPERPGSGQGPPGAFAAQLPGPAAASSLGVGPGGCAAQAAAHADPPACGAARDPEQAASSAGGSPEGAAAPHGQPADGGCSAAPAARSSRPNPAQGGGRAVEPPVRVAWAHYGRVAAALRAPSHGLRDLLPPAGLVPPATLAALRYAAIRPHASSDFLKRALLIGPWVRAGAGLTCSHAHILPLTGPGAPRTRAASRGPPAPGDRAGTRWSA